MKQARRLRFGAFTAPIVTCGGGGVGVAGDLVDGGEVGPGIEQVADHGAAAIVQGKDVDGCAAGAAAERVAHRLAGLVAELDLAALGEGQISAAGGSLRT